MDSKKSGLEIELDKETEDDIKIIAYRKVGEGWSQIDDITVQKIYEDNGEIVVFTKMSYKI